MASRCWGGIYVFQKTIADGLGLPGADIRSCTSKIAGTTPPWCKTPKTTVKMILVIIVGICRGVDGSDISKGIHRSGSDSPRTTCPPFRVLRWSRAREWPVPGEEQGTAAPGEVERTKAPTQRLLLPRRLPTMTSQCVQSDRLDVRTPRYDISRRYFLVR